MKLASELERAFETYVAQLAPELAGSYVTEYRFHPTRAWRFDVAFVPERLAIELQGGVWSGGRHTRGRGYEQDIEKHNAAVAAGWRVLYFTSSHLHSDPAGCIGQVVALLASWPNHGNHHARSRASPCSISSTLPKFRPSLL